MSDEVNNLVEMLEEELEWLRSDAGNRPENASAHKRTRICLTLAKAIQELQSAAPQHKSKD